MLVDQRLIQSPPEKTGTVAETRRQTLYRERIRGTHSSKWDVPLKSHPPQSSGNSTEEEAEGV